jgi:hypothetical protein
LRTRFLLALGLFALAFSASAAPAWANHSWNGYHWARSANPFPVKLGDNMTSNWDPYLATAASDWNNSTVLDTPVVAGQSRGRCKPTSGRVEVCNDTYGFNGWLGIAQIWLSGGHIVQGTTKMNDSYFNTSTYNSPAWRQLVICQEVGHTFGLDHQDENFDNPNLGTCMDYTNDPSTNQHPNQHDYDELVTIYGSHLDSYNSWSGTPLAAPESTGAHVDWLSPSHSVEHLGAGFDLHTFILWAGPGKPR